MKLAFTACLLLCALSSHAADTTFTLHSTDIAANTLMADKYVFNSFGCTGENQSPQLSWSHAPVGTKSFVVTVYDPDAPTGSGWWHWVLFNLPANVTSLQAGTGNGGELPAGAIQSRTDFGTSGYGGPCPPPGAAHHYIFKVTALKVEKLDLDANASAALVGFMTNMNSLGSATLTALYGRQAGK